MDLVGLVKSWARIGIKFLISLPKKARNKATRFFSDQIVPPIPSYLDKIKIVHKNSKKLSEAKFKRVFLDHLKKKALHINPAHVIN